MTVYEPNERTAHSGTARAACGSHDSLQTERRLQIAVAGVDDYRDADAIGQRT